MPARPEKPLPTPNERILNTLTRRELRDTCHIHNTTLGETLTTLQATGRVRVEAGRVQLALL